MEHRGDIFDQASDQEEAYRSAAIRAASGSLRESHPEFDGATCLDCSDEMPVERLKLGRIRCVRCQTLLEKRRKGL